MNWRDWIIDGYVNQAHAGQPEMRPKFSEAATVEQIDALEAALGMHLPRSLRELLQESNGVYLEMCCQSEWFVFLTLVWSCDEMAERNRAIRTEADAPVTPGHDVSPLFFANAAVDGILLAFFVHGSGAEDPAVHAYYPIEQSWRKVSPSLDVHLLGYSV
jgi:cell wall assembly regulator SMI1